MIKVCTVEQIRQIEANADAAGYSYDTMMQTAGRAVAHRIMHHVQRLTDPAEARVTFLIGAGNNGGDGLVAARIVSEETNALVRLYLLKRRDDPIFEAAQARGLFIAHAEDDQRYRLLTNLIASAHIVVDALFGIGIEPPLRDTAAKLLREVTQALDLRDDPPEDRAINLLELAPRQARPVIIAVDCPSGIDCDTGEVDRNTPTAAETVTFIAAKPGLFSFPGAAHVGDLIVAPLGIPANTEPLKSTLRIVIDADTARDMLPPRPADGHKGTFGTAVVVAGSKQYVGAVGLAAQGVYRAGAGYVRVAAPREVVSALAPQMLEVTWTPLDVLQGSLSPDAVSDVRQAAENAAALLFGPGMGGDDSVRAFVEALLNSGELPPLVIDADGLNHLVNIDQWWAKLPAETVLTPHPGEMARLTGRSTGYVQANRWEVVAESAQKWNAVVVLKGAHTLIAHPDGRVAVLPVKTSALATAGTGDVLAGMITGLRAQGTAAFDAAAAGAFLHATAGLIAAEQIGSERAVVAGDVLATVGQAFRRIRD